MATLHIPDESLQRYTKFLDDTRIYWDGEETLTFLEQFIENNSVLKPCPYYGSVNIELKKPHRYFIAQTCIDCGATGPNIADNDEIESDLSDWNQRDDSGNCPWCDFTGEPEQDGGNGEFFAWCPECESGGPSANTPEEAKRLWKNRSG